MSTAWPSISTAGRRPTPPSRGPRRPRTGPTEARGMRAFWLHRPVPFTSRGAGYVPEASHSLYKSSRPAPFRIFRHRVPRQFPREAPFVGDGVHLRRRAFLFLRAGILRTAAPQQATSIVRPGATALTFRGPYFGARISGPGAIGSRRLARSASHKKGPAHETSCTRGVLPLSVPAHSPLYAECARRTTTGTPIRNGGDSFRSWTTTTPEP